MKNLIILLGFILTLPGCGLFQAIQENRTTAELSVKYGTLKYIGDDKAKAVRIVEASEKIRVYATQEKVSIALIDQFIRSLIDWHSLDLADQILLDALLNQLAGQLAENMSQGMLSEDDLVTVLSVIDWVQSAAAMVR